VSYNRDMYPIQPILSSNNLNRISGCVAFSLLCQNKFKHHNTDKIELLSLKYCSLLKTFKEMEVSNSTNLNKKIIFYMLYFRKKITRLICCQVFEYLFLFAQD
jgi:hypothetical protein